jgi:hypothetical protein
MDTFLQVSAGPTTSIDLFIDDIGISSTGTFKQVLADLKSATAAVYVAATEDLKSVISPDKANLVASDATLGKLLAEWLGALSGICCNGFPELDGQSVVLGCSPCGMGPPCVLSDIPYVTVSKYFVRDLGKEFVQQSMQRRLEDSEHERAVEMLERGLWVEPPSVLLEL